MSRTTAQLEAGPPADSYAELVTALPPRPLHDAVGYEAAVEMIERLVGFELNADQADYLDALATFVEAYEQRRHPGPGRAGGRALLIHLLEINGLSADELGDILGVARETARKIVSGHRSITAEHARSLGERFGVKAGAFIVEG